jgi:hypothetical protein
MIRESVARFKCKMISNPFPDILCLMARGFNGFNGSEQIKGKSVFYPDNPLNPRSIL